MSMVKEEPSWFVGYAYNISDLWNSLDDELRKWLPPAGAEIVMNELKRKFGSFHYVMILSSASDTPDEALKRIQSLKNEIGANREILEEIKIKRIKPIVFRDLSRILFPTGDIINER